MKIDDYRLLINLKDYRTIRATAKKVLISQPAITQRLKYVEETLGGKIFLRTPKQLVPTSFGEVVLEHAVNVIKNEEALRNRLALTNSSISGTLSIGASSLFSQYFLPEVLRVFTEKYPDVTVDLVTGVSEEIRQSAEDFHVCVIRGEPLNEFECDRLFSDPLHLFDTYPLKKGEERPFIEFKSDPGFQRLIENWMSSQKQIRFRRSMKVDHFETAKQMMKRGLGMTVLPESISLTEMDTCAHIPLVEGNRSYTRETWICRKEVISQLPQVDAFLKEIMGKDWTLGG
ncbi:LysR family transcriptional regulator [Halobacillus mangrovi]|uniref:LysR family transcriptional regulator n=1 Tax=Halobacillus mangrovi TaxID=402384 RepID=A0A1W6A093_9BACI|nr:LysR family transcriptional regulator [Halobacillus mangrovi]ARI78939.1 LysR family transcriptional regulator [Halobacillus mangrovi]